MLLFRCKPLEIPELIARQLSAIAIAIAVKQLPRGSVHVAWHLRLLTPLSTDFCDSAYKLIYRALGVICPSSSAA